MELHYVKLSIQFTPGPPLGTPTGQNPPGAPYSSVTSLMQQNQLPTHHLPVHHHHHYHHYHHHPGSHPTNSSCSMLTSSNRLLYASRPQAHALLDQHAARKKRRRKRHSCHTAPPTFGMDNHNSKSKMMITESTVSDDSAARLGDLSLAPSAN